MLHITVPETHTEYFDENTQEFVYINVKQRTLTMEHSLISISKWEAKWKKPYLDTKKTAEETLDYIRCMTITPNVPNEIYSILGEENYKKINDYVNDPMTATTFRDTKRGGRKEVVTSEIIYYWMIAQQIPIQFEKWHLNRLMTLIKVCAIKNSSGNKKMSRSEILRQNAALNKARRAKHHTKG